MHPTKHAAQPAFPDHLTGTSISPRKLCHRPKIGIIMQQGPAVLDALNADHDALNADQEIYGFANGDAEPAQGSEIARGDGRDYVAGHLYDLEAAQQSLAEHQVAHDDFFDTEK
jgi:hypothetical protein